MLRTDAITKCRVIQKIEKTLNNITHTATQKRTNRHSLREVNRGAFRHLHISHNTPCLRPPSPLPAPKRNWRQWLCTILRGNRGVLYIMRDVQMANRLTAFGNQRNARKTLTNVFYWNFDLLQNGVFSQGCSCNNEVAISRVKFVYSYCGILSITQPPLGRFQASS